VVIQGLDAKESGCAPEFFLDTKQLVVLGDAIGA
jgi:hypothetical protein